ncbi:hypothetical protein N7468_008787 [Penicillium chermesinum]|uniref:Arylamine N-acetyltransferase n=1 Tax=Penicillium chermesinum TaxID=63820 RepID=A0A9W9NH06_9EURO|nr:uncharacterized protein N7468_008787 [Penicillium chermesinum]KAJ5219583.1 hypothetical protein N7468_008787 [Penicillium chermesinum]
MASAFSQQQLSKYLRYMALPAQYAPYLDDPQSFPKTEEALTHLFRCQVTRFPYDNLTVHYSATHLANIDPAAIYNKFMGVGDAAPSHRGGYCLECSIFFHHVLKGLGILRLRNRRAQSQAYQWGAAGRAIRRRRSVRGDGPTRPLRLVSGYTVQNMGRQEVRLIYGNIPNQSRPEQKLWIYQYRNGPEMEWNSFYSFGEAEWFQVDFEVINRYTSWETFDLRNQWLVKFLRGGETGNLPVEEGEVVDAVDGEIAIVGKLMFVNGVVKLNLGGKTRVIHTCETEEDKRVAFKKYFLMDIDTQLK